jgi:prolyl-tRNA editing enzyme YbaK/EbsC (Cys-tRNA(Pro) deacylase)
VSRALDRFLRSAWAMGIAPDDRRFPEGTKTAADAARAIGCDVAQIVKSLVFVVDATPVLALTSGRNRVDTAKLAALCGGGSARRANPEEVRQATAFAIGGTPPFGHPRPLRAFVDRDLLGLDEVWAAAGTPDAVFPLTPNELLRLAEAIPADIAESDPADRVPGRPRVE